MSGRAQGRPKKRGSGSSTASGNVPRAGRVCSAVGAQGDGARRQVASSQRTPMRMASIFSNHGANVERHSEAVMEMMAEVDDVHEEPITSQTSVTGSTPTSSCSSSQRPPLSVVSTPAVTDDDTFPPLSPASENVLMGVLSDDAMMVPVAHDVAQPEDSYDEEEGPGVICVEEVLVSGDDFSLDEEEHSPYVPDEFSEGSSEEDGSQQRGHHHMSGTGKSRSGRGRQESQPSASASTTIRSSNSTSTTQLSGRAAAPASSQKGKFTSPIWNFFHVSPKDDSFAVCNTCKKVLSRGRNPSKMGTSSLQTHLERKHKNDFVAFKRLQEQKGVGKSTRTIVQHSGGEAASSLPHGHRQGQTLKRSSSLSSAASAAHATDIEAGESSQSSLFSSLPSTAQSSARIRQTLLSDNFGRASKPLPPRNWRIRKLNGLLAQAMCSQLLPYSLVNKGSAMRALLQFGIPEWEIPSRHYFARTAIPALHAFVVGNVARSLEHAVGERVHITMDSWSSRFGTGRYLSITAHWVTLMEVGENPAAAGQLVVPPRALKGDAAGSLDPIPSTPCKQARLSSSIKPQQCQALLKLVSLGKEKLTGKYILETLKEQEESWLTPRGLKVGNVASDNGSNLLAALRLGDLDHIPCLAHVLNLVVQRFLRTYPGMEQLLETARKVVRHVRRSATAAATLADLQHDEGLPSHRLIIDLPTRWNSTLAMLQRLFLHREAVDKYIYDVNYKRIPRTQTSASNRLPVISADQWAQIQQVCLVLVPFLQGTKMVSRDRASLCEWVPLVCMLDRAVCNMLEAGEEAVSQQEVEQLQQEEEEEEEEEDRDLQAVGEELEVPNIENEGELQSAASVVRGWRLQEDTAQEEEVTNNILLEGDEPNFSETAHLFPMAAHMLRCLRRDPRVRQMREREDIWISLILDPRLKGKLGQFLAPSTTASRTKELQEALVRRLQEAFPLPSTTPTVAVLPSQQQVPASTTTTTSSSIHRLGDLLSLTQSLYAVELPRAEVPATESSSNQQQRLSRMVSEYMGSFSGLDTDSPVEPMEYWVRRLSLWRELAQYALEVLACPPSSVLSERCFSAAGGVVTEKRSRLSADSVDKLTFLKMNQAWVEGEFLAPIVGDRRK